LTLEGRRLGSDVLLLIYGGDLPHIGSISVAFPSASPFRDGHRTVSVSTVSLPGHKDYVLSNELSERVSKELNCVATVLVGIHIDNASKDEIDLVIEAARELVTEFISLQVP